MQPKHLSNELFSNKTMGKQCNGMKNGFLGPIYTEGIFREMHVSGM